jgi:pimeloyl-ACP methyl ester carboxylesterase
MIKITMKRIALFLILTFIYTNIIVQVNTQAQFNPFQQPQSPTCINGKKNYNNPLIPNYSFCYDSSIEVSDNIRKANNEEIDNYYQITKSKSLNLIGQIQLKKGNDTVIMDIKEGKTAYSPQNYCTTENLNESNDPYGVFQTPRGSFVHVSPTLNYDYQTEYSEKYNGLKDNESNILNAKVPYKTEPTKVPTPYDINLNAYIDNINFDSKKINAENTVDAKESKYPFTLTIQGHQLQYQSNKDKEIIRNKGYNPNSYNITKQTLITKSDTTPDQMSEDFLKGKGRCFDNTHRLYGIRLNTDLIINNQHSSGYNISPEANKDYKEVIQKDNNKSKTEYQFSSQQIPSIKIYSSTNILSSFADTLESICWNELSCERRDKILSRTPILTSMLPKTPLSKDVDRLKELKKDDKFALEELERTKDPFKNSKVKLKYIIHCDDKAELIGSEVPSPTLTRIKQKDDNLKKYTIEALSIPKNTPIDIETQEHVNCSWLNFKYDVVTKTYNIKDSSIEHVANLIYKNSLQIKDEDVIKNWAETANNYSSYKFNFDVEARPNIAILPIPNPFGGGQNITSTDELYGRTRVYGQFNFQELESRKGKTIEFKYGDERQKLPLGINNGLGKYLNESQRGNILKIPNSQKILDVNNRIEMKINVNGSNSNAFGKNKKDTSPESVNDTFDNDNRKVNLEFINDEDRRKYSFEYDNINKPAVWIVSHGWCDTRGSFRPIASEIKKSYPNDIVFTLDWSEASFNNCGVIVGQNAPEGVRNAATWIEPTAEEVSKALKKWGLKNGNQLRVVGHSLGTMMSGEISSKFEEKASLLVALDPPSESKINSQESWFAVPYLSMNLVSRVNEFLNPMSKLIGLSAEQRSNIVDNIGNTNYKVSKTKSREQFKDYAQRSVAYYGKYSIAGNRAFASTANESYELDFHFDDYFADLGSEHQLVHQAFKNMANNQNLKNKSEPFDFGFYLNDLWNDRSKIWIRNQGRKLTDNGIMDGYGNPDKWDGAVNWVEGTEAFDNIKTIKRYEK